MRLRTLLSSAFAAAALITGSGFVVTQASEAAATSTAGGDEASIIRSIQARWIESGTVESSAIRIDVMDGAVVLSGNVRSEAEALLAEDVATRVHGVLSVRNLLSVHP